VRTTKKSFGAVRLHSAACQVHRSNNDPRAQLWSPGDSAQVGDQRKEGEAHFCSGCSASGDHEVFRFKVAV